MNGHTRMQHGRTRHGHDRDRARGPLGPLDRDRARARSRSKIARSTVIKYGY